MSFPQPPFAVTVVDVEPVLPDWPNEFNNLIPALPGMSNPLIQYGGALYWLIQFSGSTPAPVMMLKSTDGGSVWAALDAAHSPQRASTESAIDGGVYFDGAHTVTYAWNAGYPSGSLSLQDFNLATGTWGAIYGTASPPTIYSSGYCTKLAGGITAVFTNRTTVGLNVVGINLNWWNGSAWSSAAVDGNVPVGCVANGAAYAVVYDPTNPSGPLGAFHCFGRYTGLTYGMFYQLVDAKTGTLGRFQDLSSITDSGQEGNSFFQCGSPVIVGNQVLYGATDNATGESPILLIGTPLSAPVFTASAPIDPAYSEYNTAPVPVFAFDGTTLYAAVPDYNNSILRLGYTTDLSSPGSGWSFVSGNFTTNIPAATLQSYPFIWCPGPNLIGVSSEGTVGILEGSATQVAFYLSAVSAVSITCGTTPAGTVGVPYSNTFPASGGTPPYAFAIIAGSLPPGVTLDASTGVASGTPTLAGDYPFTIQVTDSASNTAQADCSILIEGGSVNCGSAPSAVGQPYSNTFEVTGGTPPYTFAITAGSLPPGITLDSSTGTAAGTPKVPGTFPFTLTVTDSVSDTFSVNCSISVSGSASTQIFGGNPFPFARCCAKNAWDACLEALADCQRQIRFPDSCIMPPGLKAHVPWDPDLAAYPAQSKPWIAAGGLLTPTPAQGDQLVCSFLVPLGYDALFSGVFIGYSGIGFEQGSGDIVWRTKVNIHYAQDLGNVEFLCGTDSQPLPLTEGQILFSGSLVSLVVSVPNLSGNIQVGASRIWGGMLGFMWPR